MIDITYEKEGEGEIYGVSQAYPGDEIKIKAVPDEGWNFQEWGFGSEDEKDTFAVPDDDVTIVAIFKKDDLYDFLIKKAKMMLQDFEELNHILLEGDRKEEFNWDELRECIDRALANINMKPPQTSFTLKNFPKLKDFNWKLVVDGAIIEALKMKGVLKIRNEMNYQDQGGTTVRLEGKGQNYMQVVNNFYQSWHNQLMDFKEMISVEAAWGGVHSGYYRNRW